MEKLSIPPTTFVFHKYLSSIFPNIENFHLETKLAHLNSFSHASSSWFALILKRFKEFVLISKALRKSESLIFDSTIFKSFSNFVAEANESLILVASIVRDLL
ncbi:CLUMA_CG007990, isoform A [Clunio marinus]|uniref:CLUMA_CG007990, isoform A n=1 Tax=Clunio marinus TaxID=568069 RepID=A0A1J1I4G9_9DIPT|nr:CLUMA_CG007990, isoform A [Clunio marinus]